MNDMRVRFRLPLLIIFMVVSIVAAWAFQAQPPAGQAGVKYKVGDRDPKGRLVMFVMTNGKKDVPVLLETSYGVLLSNDNVNEMKNPRPRYTVGFRREGKVVSTNDLSEFRKALKRIKKGTKVGWYDTCSVLRSYGLPWPAWQRFEESVKRAGLKLGPQEGKQVTCYCDLFLSSAPLKAFTLAGVRAGRGRWRHGPRLTRARSLRN